jgi:hypothetical protein
MGSGSGAVVGLVDGHGGVRVWCGHCATTVRAVWDTRGREGGGGGGGALRWGLGGWAPPPPPPAPSIPRRCPSPATAQPATRARCGLSPHRFIVCYVRGAFSGREAARFARLECSSPQREVHIPKRDPPWPNPVTMASPPHQGPVAGLAGVFGANSLPPSYFADLRRSGGADAPAAAPTGMWRSGDSSGAAVGHAGGWGGGPAPTSLPMSSPLTSTGYGGGPTGGAYFSAAMAPGSGGYGFAAATPSIATMAGGGSGYGPSFSAPAGRGGGGGGGGQMAFAPGAMHTPQGGGYPAMSHSAGMMAALMASRGITMGMGVGMGGGAAGSSSSSSMAGTLGAGGSAGYAPSSATGGAPAGQPGAPGSAMTVPGGGGGGGYPFMWKPQKKK